jgi:hypothetical protein
MENSIIQSLKNSILSHKEVIEKESNFIIENETKIVILQ